MKSERNMHFANCYIALQFPGQYASAMKKSTTSRPSRTGSIAHIAGIDYADLEAHFGYALKRAQVASFEAFSLATDGESITPPRFTALVILERSSAIVISAACSPVNYIRPATSAVHPRQRTLMSSTARASREAEKILIILRPQP